MTIWPCQHVKSVKSSKLKSEKSIQARKHGGGACKRPADLTVFIVAFSSSCKSMQKYVKVIKIPSFCMVGPFWTCNSEIG